jgi:DNA-binding NarL/FixJ family response regulator
MFSLKRKVLLISERPVMREGFTLLIGRESDMIVCGSCGSLRETIRVIPNSDPAIVVMDLDLGDMGAVELIGEVAVRFPKLPILIFSVTEGAIYAKNALRGGQGVCAPA